MIRSTDSFPSVVSLHEPSTFVSLSLSVPCLNGPRDSHVQRHKLLVHLAPLPPWYSSLAGYCRLLLLSVRCSRNQLLPLPLSYYPRADQLCLTDCLPSLSLCLVSASKVEDAAWLSCRSVGCMIHASRPREPSCLDRHSVHSHGTRLRSYGVTGWT